MYSRFSGFASILLLCLVVFSSCKKESITEQVHQNKIVEGNEIPPYSGVSDIQVENFINRVYIDLLGIEPEENVMANHLSDMKSLGLSEAAKAAVAESITNSSAYFKRFQEVTTSRFIQGADSNYIADGIEQLQAIVDFYYSSGDPATAHTFEIEILKLEELQIASDELESGAIDLNEYMSRFIYNFIYDDINMGSQNFVNSCFESLFFRFPTQQELINSISMVDGEPNQVLLVDGSSKLDFVHIMTHDKEFYEGLIINAYYTLLARVPTSDESFPATENLMQGGDYTQALINIIKTEEYAGF